MSLSCRDPVFLFQIHNTYAPANYDIIGPDDVLFQAIILINDDIVSEIVRESLVKFEMKYSIFHPRKWIEHSSARTMAILFRR